MKQEILDSLNKTDVDNISDNEEILLRKLLYLRKKHSDNLISKVKINILAITVSAIIGSIFILSSNLLLGILIPLAIFCGTNLITDINLNNLNLESLGLTKKDFKYLIKSGQMDKIKELICKIDKKRECEYYKEIFKTFTEKNNFNEKYSTSKNDIYLLNNKESSENNINFEM